MYFKLVLNIVISKMFLDHRDRQTIYNSSHLITFSKVNNIMARLEWLLLLTFDSLPIQNLHIQ